MIIQEFSGFNNFLMGFLKHTMCFSYFPNNLNDGKYPKQLHLSLSFFPLMSQAFCCPCCPPSFCERNSPFEATSLQRRNYSHLIPNARLDKKRTYYPSRIRARRRPSGQMPSPRGREVESLTPRFQSHRNRASCSSHPHGCCDSCSMETQEQGLEEPFRHLIRPCHFRDGETEAWPEATLPFCTGQGL